MLLSLRIGPKDRVWATKSRVGRLCSKSVSWSQRPLPCSTNFSLSSYQPNRKKKKEQRTKRSLRYYICNTTPKQKNKNNEKQKKNELIVHQLRHSIKEERKHFFLLTHIQQSPVNGSIRHRHRNGYSKWWNLGCRPHRHTTFKILHGSI